MRRLLLPLLLLLVVSCAPVKLTNVVVVGKHHHDAWTQILPVYNGKTTTLVPRYHPEEWHLVITGDRPDGRRETRGVSVSEATYNRLSIGDKVKGD